MKPERKQELRAACEAAPDATFMVHTSESIISLDIAPFYKLARGALPELLDEVERLQARITRDEEHEAAQDDDIIRLMQERNAAKAALEQMTAANVGDYLEITTERDRYKAALEEISEATMTDLPFDPFAKHNRRLAEKLIGIRSIARQAIKGTDGLPTTAELSGSDPDFTGGMESVQYVRMLRGDPHASASGAEGGQR